MPRMEGILPICVIHSLMPKGVEHCMITPDNWSIQSVIHSLMPKGVEHIHQTEHQGSDACDSFVDAERR